MNLELTENGDRIKKTEDNNRPGVTMLRSWLNKNMKVEMSDGRFLVGIFLCTDRAGNVIIGSCNEYTSDPDKEDIEHSAEARILGLAMVPGHHVTKLWVDLNNSGINRRTNSPQGDSDDCL